MKWFSISLLLAMFGQAADLTEYPAAHATPKRVWIRRVTLGAACAASVGFDSFTTHRAISSGAVETNPLMGRASAGRMIGIKAGMCAASAFAQEWRAASHTPRTDWTVTGVNLGVTAGYTRAGIHNLHVTNDLLKSE